jgi:hypothetical protein
MLWLAIVRHNSTRPTMNCDFHWTGSEWECSECGFRFRPVTVGPRKPPRKNCSVVTTRLICRARAGQWLHWLVKFILREEITPSCQCRAMACKMNGWGLMGCLHHISDITRGMVDEAAKRGWRIAKRKMVSAVCCVSLIAIAIAVSQVEKVICYVVVTLKRTVRR